MTLSLITMICLWSILPGPITMLIMSEAWTRGQKAALFTALGGCGGVASYAGLSATIGTLILGDGQWIEALEGVGTVLFALIGGLLITHSFVVSAKDNAT